MKRRRPCRAAALLCVYGRVMEDRDLAARPTVCPNGHPLGPGKFSLSWAWCGEPCGGGAQGHHWLICGTCRARIRLGHDGAVWERT